MPEEYQKDSYVDAAGIGGRKMLLPGEIPEMGLSLGLGVGVSKLAGKSAEVIVVAETSRHR